MANWITLARLPLLVGIVLLLYVDVPQVQVATAPLVLVLIFMDTLDGVVARRRHEVGMLGSKLDIGVDRIVELVLWIVYAHLNLISVAIPVIFVIRGGLVDTVRSFSLVWGETSFGMMRTKWGRRLVVSGFMRSLYGMSLKPTTETSNGHDRPLARTASIAPRASRSLAATTAEVSGCSSSNVVVTRYPSSSFWRWAKW